MEWSGVESTKAIDGNREIEGLKAFSYLVEWMTMSSSRVSPRGSVKMLPLSFADTQQLH